jgi:hypothetical protein
LRNLRIGREQRSSLDLSLRDQHAIEWIRMQRRQALNCERVFRQDWDLPVAAVKKPAAQRTRINLEVAPSQAAFDDDFPQAGGTECKRLLGVLEQTPCCGRQALGSARRPQQPDACRAIGSLAGTEQTLDLSCAHAVEIVRYGLAFQKTEAPFDCDVAGCERHHFDKRTARLGDDKSFARRSPFDQAREVGLGFVDIDGFHEIARGSDLVELT